MLKRYLGILILATLLPLAACGDDSKSGGDGDPDPPQDTMDDTMTDDTMTKDGMTGDGMTGEDGMSGDGMTGDGMTGEDGMSGDGMTGDGTSTGSQYVLEVSDQTLSVADELTVPTVETGDQDAWLVIHEENEAGDSFGGVIGTSDLLEANGEYTDVNVTLDRPARDGETLYAMLHYDDPADGEYTFGETEGDDPPITKNGSVLVKSFGISLENQSKYSISVSDQTLEDPQTVTIDSFALGPRDAFIVIHEENDAGDSFGAVIGVSDVYSADTNTEDVTVQLDREAVDGETLYAMLHYDDPADGEYTFGEAEGEDTPIQVNGDVVVTPFTVTVN